MHMQTFCRHFQWHALMLWPDDMPEKTIVFVSGEDTLVPAQLVIRHMELAARHAAIRYHSSSRHGGYLYNKSFQDCVVSSITCFLQS